jgi:hypothetical protein
MITLAAMYTNFLIYGYFRGHRTSFCVGYAMQTSVTPSVRQSKQEPGNSTDAWKNTSYTISFHSPSLACPETHLKMLTIHTGVDASGVMK